MGSKEVTELASTLALKKIKNELVVVRDGQTCQLVDWNLEGFQFENRIWFQTKPTTR